MIPTSVIQFAPVFGDIEKNIQKLNNDFDSAWNSKLVVLPELASTGYNFKCKEEAFELSEEINESKYVGFLIDKASRKGCYIVSGINERDGENLYNSSVLIGPDGLIGCYRKLHLFKNEKTIFQPGNQLPEMYETSIGNLGMLICFDWMFPEVWRVLATKGVDIICHPSNLVLPYCQGVVPSYSLVNRLFIITANRVGQELELKFTGNSVISNPRGEILARGSETQDEVVTVEIDVEIARDKWITAENHLLNDRRTDVYGNFEVDSEA